MIFNQIEHYDHFDTETLFWAELSDLPESVQSKAREIDGANFIPSCFGVCVIYDWENGDFDLIVDVDVSTGEHCNVYYIDNDGDKHWFKVNLSPEFTQEIYAECVKKWNATAKNKIAFQQVEGKAKSHQQKPTQHKAPPKEKIKKQKER